MKISMIAAITPDRVIGSADGGVPWRGKVPRDSRHFRDSTEGKWLALGRTTYEEMEGWFTTQVPIILTSRTDYRPFQRDHLVADSVENAIQQAEASGAGELVIGGGAVLYEKALPFADTLDLTIVETDVQLEALKYFPSWNETEWSLLSEERFEPDEENELVMTFQIWRRLSL